MIRKEFSTDNSVECQQSLIDKKASWHKYCRGRFNSTKLERLRKRKIFEREKTEGQQNVNDSLPEESCSSPVKARR